MAKLDHSAQRLTRGTRGSAAGKALIYAGMLTAPWLTVRPFANTTVSDFLFLAAAVWALFAHRPNNPNRLSAMWTGAYLFTMGGLLSLAQLGSALAGAAVVIRILLIMLILPQTLKSLLSDEQAAATSFLWFTLGCGISGAVAVLQAVFGWSFSTSSETSLGRLPGLAQHVNDQGGQLAAAASFAAVALMTGIWRQRAATAGAVALVLCFLGLILSGSVTGMGSTLIGLLGGAVLSRVRLTQALKWLFFGTVACCALLLAQARLVPASTNPLQRLLQSTGHTAYSQQDTLASRIETDRVALTWISERPITGRGFDPQNDMAVGTVAIHNLILGFWALGGVISMIGLVVWLGGAFARAWMQRRNALGPALAAMIAESVFSMTAPIEYQRYFWLPFVVVYSLRSHATTRTVVGQPRSAHAPGDRNDLVKSIGPHLNARST